MPRVGLFCEVDGSFVTDEECLNCALHYLKRKGPDGTERHCQFNYPEIHARVSKGAERKHAGTSVSNLCHCLRKSKYEKTVPYAVFPRSLTASVSGDAYHDYMHKHRESLVIAEVRLRKIMPSGRAITGQMDRYRPDLGLLEDMKRKDKPFDQKAPPLGYVEQLNAYGYMIRTGCHIVNEDGSDGDFLQGPINELVLLPSAHNDSGTRVQVPIWPDELCVRVIEAALDQLERPIPARNELEPARSVFCTGYCPFVDRCITDGDDFDHPVFEIPQTLQVLR